MKSSLKILSFLLLITYLFLIWQQVFADETGGCPYEWQIDQCVQENQWWDPRSIEDFTCPQTADKAEIAYQVVLDMKFKEQDKQAEQEVKNIENNCDKRYGENATEDEIKVPDEITSIYSPHGKYWEKYNKLLDPNNKDGILVTTTKCLWGSTPIDQASDFLSPALAKWMMEAQLSVYGDTAYDELKLCKEKVRQDSRKKMMQGSRGKYSSVMDIMESILWYLEALAHKWPSKTENAHNS